MGTGWAESWSQKGKTWICSSGIQLSFPSNYLLKQGSLSSITCENDSGSFTFVPAQGAELRRQGLAGFLEMFTSKSVVFPKEWEKRKSNQVTIFLKRAPFGANGDLPGNAIMGVADKGEAHLIFMLLLPEKISPELQTELDGILSSFK
jgi:hypothetical protein